MAHSHLLVHNKAETEYDAFFPDGTSPIIEDLYQGPGSELIAPGP